MTEQQSLPNDAAPLPRKKRRRLYGWLLVGLVLILAALGYREFWLARPIGQGPAGPAVDRHFFQEPWTSRPVLVLGVGDSITAGLGAKSVSHRSFNRVIANPEDEFLEMQGICLEAVLPNLQSENMAISGSTSLTHENRLRDMAEVESPETLGIVLMTTGGNDLIHSYGRTAPREGAMYGATLAEAKPWIAAFERRLHTMIKLLEGRFPGGCHVFLADIYDPTDGVGDAMSVFLPDWSDGLAIHAQYNEIIHRAAAEQDNVHLVPLHQTFLGHGSHCRQFWRAHYCREDPHYWFHHNIEDPNDRGYDAIRRLYLIAIAETLHEVEAYRWAQPTLRPASD